MSEAFCKLLLPYRTLRGRYNLPPLQRRSPGHRDVFPGPLSLDKAECGQVCVSLKLIHLLTFSSSSEKWGRGKERTGRDWGKRVFRAMADRRSERKSNCVVCFTVTGENERHTDTGRDTVASGERLWWQH